MTLYTCTTCHRINAPKPPEAQLLFCWTCGGAVVVVSDELPFDDELKPVNMIFSEEKQSFKIGRITYSLPSFIDKGMSRYWINFEHNKNGWEAYYIFDDPTAPDEPSLLNCTEPTFNKALKALHKKVKETQTP